MKKGDDKENNRNIFLLNKNIKKETIRNIELKEETDL